jgi:hypothetical protein
MFLPYLIRSWMTHKSGPGNMSLVSMKYVFVFSSFYFCYVFFSGRQSKGFMSRSDGYCIRQMSLENCRNLNCGLVKKSLCRFDIIKFKTIESKI